MANRQGIRRGVFVVGLCTVLLGGARLASAGGCNPVGLDGNDCPDVSQTQMQHQHQIQKQTQSQVNQPNQNVAPSQSVTIDVPRQAPAVVPPALTSAGQNVCLGSFSVGVSVYGAGAAFGKTTTDKGCERRNNAALLYQFGQPNAALRLLMLDEEVSEALNPTKKKAAAIEEMLAPLVNRPWEPVSTRREGP